MNLEEVKNKLEFNKILDKLRFYASSDLGLNKIESIQFYTNKADLEIELSNLKETIDFISIESILELAGLKDISKELDLLKIEGNYINSEKYLWILNFLKISRVLKSTIAQKNRDSYDKYSRLKDITENLYADKILEHNIDITIDENGEVKDSASVALKKIRKEIRIYEEKVRKTLAKILKDLSEKEYSQEDIITQRDGRLVIPVKSENKRKVGGIVHNASTTGATVFIEPTESIELNNEITELHFKEKREIQKILIELSRQIAVHHEELKANCEILAEVDFLQAKARYALEIGGSAPVISENINLINAYHPVLLQNHKRSEVIPLNVAIGEDYFTLVITGPNAGGKTVALKTVGLIQLMFQSGLFVPTDEYSNLKLCSKIFVNIGDEQSLDNDLSTFSSHLLAIKDVLDHADDKSLILIDEICSGTDPNLGSALSSALIKEFTERKSFTIVTTHIGELKKFAYSTPGVRNASLEFDYKTLSPNFKFIIGVPGQSFTFEIAQKFHYPEKLLGEAKKYADKDDTKIEDLIKELNEGKQKYEKLKNNYDIENSRLKSLVDLYEKHNTEIEKSKKDLIKSAKLEADKIVRDANKLIESTIKQIKEAKDVPIKEIKEQFRTEATKLTDVSGFNEDVEDTEPIIEGDLVKIKGSHSTGEVVNISKDIASININGLIMKAKLSDLEKTSKKNIQQTEYTPSAIEFDEKPVTNRLDLRGKYANEIADMIEEFIHEAKSNNFKEVSIVHGKGSGKLRDEVKRILSKTSGIASYRLGNWNEGDMGVTIVELN
jgi:DNA mismatch repair protein MutS2